MSEVEDLRSRIEEHRRILGELESELRAARREARQEKWFPQGFYLAYYVLTGMLLGAVASWVTLAANVIGASIVGIDELELLRVYATIIGGAETAQGRDAVVIVFALGLHTCTGVICGTPIHVVYSRFLSGQGLILRALTGAAVGLLMWLINFYAILTWFQPVLTGESSSYIVENVPWWVAAGSHVLFAEVVVFLQPFAEFDPMAYPTARTNA